MRVETRVHPVHKKQIVFLFPLVYRPQKINFSGKYTLLSKYYKGHIIAFSGGKQRNVPLSEFMFHSNQRPSNSVMRFILGLWTQITVPLRLVWGRTKVDAVVAYDPYRSGLAALVLKRIFHCRMIVEINGEYHADYIRNETEQNIIKRFVMVRLPKLVLRSADAVKVLNARQEVFVHELIPSKPVYRFHNYVATEYFQSLSVYQGDYFLSIGHPFHLKGVDVLIEAFKQVAEKHPEVSLKIIGYCPDEMLDAYKAMADGHPRIEFIKPGWVEDVGELLRGCYALVSAARTEAMGRVLVETMACGKPIIATRTSGGMMCVEDGKTGLLCEIGDVADLSRKMIEMLADRNRAELMGRAGMVRMQQVFSEETYAENFHKMIEEVTVINHGI